MKTKLMGLFVGWCLFMVTASLVWAAYELVSGDGRAVLTGIACAIINAICFFVNLYILRDMQ